MPTAIDKADRRFLSRYLDLAENEWGLVCLGAIGDVYLVAALARAFCSEHPDDQVALIVRPDTADVARLFPDYLSRIVELPEIRPEIAKSLSEFEPGEPVVADLRWSLSGLLGQFIGYKGFHLADAYRLLLRLPLDAPLAAPRVTDEVREEADRFLEDRAFASGRTVLLAPGGWTLLPLALSFWEQVTHVLRDAGWDVWVNVQNARVPIPADATPLDFPLRLAIPIAERIGWVVSLRSGLCDVLSSADCSLTVIYPDTLNPELSFPFGKLLPSDATREATLAACSLRALYASRAVEIPYRHGDPTEPLVTQILATRSGP